MKAVLNIGEHLWHFLHGLLHLIQHPEDGKFVLHAFLYSAGAIILLLFLKSIPPGKPIHYVLRPPIISIPQSPAEKRKFKIATITLSIILVIAGAFFIMVLVKRFSA